MDVALVVLIGEAREALGLDVFMFFLTVVLTFG